jgi:hypothetical protein
VPGCRRVQSMPRMIIASRLTDGLVVFVTTEGGWATDIEAGALIVDDAEAERLLALAKEHEARSLVVDPYLIDVVVEEGQRRPAAVRERIRAFGPSVRSDLLDGSAARSMQDQDPRGRV